MPRKKQETKKSDEASILEQLLQELEQKIDAKEGKVNRKITKGQALIKSMVNEALKGDQRMMANVLKFIEKLDALQATKKQEVQTSNRSMDKVDWEIMLRYYWRYRHHLELEWERMKKKNPGAFSTKWTRIDIKDAPWYEAIYGNGEAD